MPGPVTDNSYLRFVCIISHIPIYYNFCSMICYSNRARDTITSSLVSQAYQSLLRTDITRTCYHAVSKHGISNSHFSICNISDQQLWEISEESQLLTFSNWQWQKYVPFAMNIRKSYPFLRFFTTKDHLWRSTFY